MSSYDTRSMFGLARAGGLLRAAVAGVAVVTMAACSDGSGFRPL
jgi:hypothetical protein